MREQDPADGRFWDQSALVAADHSAVTNFVINKFTLHGIEKLIVQTGIDF